MARGKPFEGLLRGAEGGAQSEAPAVVTGERGQCGQGTLGGELRGTGEMQGAYGRVLVHPGLRDLHEGVEMRCRLVGQLVPDGRGRHAPRLTQEERAAQLPLQGADLRGDRGLRQTEQCGRPRERTGAVHGDKSAQEGQIHPEPPPLPSNSDVAAGAQL